MWIDFYVHFFLSFSNARSFISVVTREIDKMDEPSSLAMTNGDNRQIFQKRILWP